MRKQFQERKLHVGLDVNSLFSSMRTMWIHSVGAVEGMITPIFSGNCPWKNCE